jgi:hypothetical protein
VEIGDLHGSGQITAVFGRRDRDRIPPAAGAHSAKLIAVFHSRLDSAEEYTLNRELGERLIKKFGPRAASDQFVASYARPVEHDNYRDLLSDPDERWLAGFASVGQTGYVVAVATPYERALRPNEELIDSLSTYAGILNLSFLVIAGVAVWASLRGTALPEDRHRD